MAADLERYSVRSKYFSTLGESFLDKPYPPAAFKKPVQFWRIAMDSSISTFGISNRKAVLLRWAVADLLTVAHGLLFVEILRDAMLALVLCYSQPCTCTLMIR